MCSNLKVCKWNAYIRAVSLQLSLWVLPILATIKQNFTLVLLTLLSLSLCPFLIYRSNNNMGHLSFYQLLLLYVLYCPLLLLASPRASPHQVVWQDDFLHPSSPPLSPSPNLNAGHVASIALTYLLRDIPVGRRTR